MVSSYLKFFFVLMLFKALSYMLIVHFVQIVYIIEEKKILVKKLL